tara:strand:- start:3919 stop:4914 length:996 start_codon:yes stop_codon:yes gene_type:complete
VAAVLAGLGGYSYWTSRDGDAVPAGIAFGNGRIEAVHVDVAAKVFGRVGEVLVHEGDLVEKGQPIARIEISELQAQLARAQADIASAESQVAAAAAEVAMSEAQLMLATQELARAASLLEQGHTSQESYDIRLTEREVAWSRLASSKANRRSSLFGVDAAKAVATEIESQIADGQLVSPVTGRVLYRLAEPGEVLAAGGKVMTIVNHDDIFMEIFLPSSQAHLVNVGSDARIKLDIFDVAIPATVSFVSPESQFTPKQVETQTERDKLVFRVKIRVMPELVRQNIERVKTGLRGIGFVRLDDGTVPPAWSTFLQELPPEALPAAASAADES